MTPPPAAEAAASCPSASAPRTQSALRRLRARGRVRGRLALLGPAFVAAVAYIDPGNFATNIAGGAKYGFLLVWVIIGANLMAMLVQYLSAKTGIATGRTLPELCREHFPQAGHASGCGSRRRRSPSPPTWRSSSAPRSRSTCSSACRRSSPA